MTKTIAGWAKQQPVARSRNLIAVLLTIGVASLPPGKTMAAPLNVITTSASVDTDPEDCEFLCIGLIIVGSALIGGTAGYFLGRDSADNTKELQRAKIEAQAKNLQAIKAAGGINEENAADVLEAAKTTVITRTGVKGRVEGNPKSAEVGGSADSEDIIGSISSNVNHLVEVIAPADPSSTAPVVSTDELPWARLTETANLRSVSDVLDEIDATSDRTDDANAIAADPNTRSFDLAGVTGTQTDFTLYTRLLFEEIVFDLNTDVPGSSTQDAHVELGYSLGAINAAGTETLFDVFDGGFTYDSDTGMEAFGDLSGVFPEFGAQSIVTATLQNYSIPIMLTNFDPDSDVVLTASRNIDSAVACVPVPSSIAFALSGFSLLAGFRAMRGRRQKKAARHGAGGHQRALQRAAACLLLGALSIATAPATLLASPVPTLSSTAISSNPTIIANQNIPVFGATEAVGLDLIALAAFDQLTLSSAFQAGGTVSSDGFSGFLLGTGLNGGDFSSNYAGTITHTTDGFGINWSSTGFYGLQPWQFSGQLDLDGNTGDGSISYSGNYNPSLTLTGGLSTTLIDILLYLLLCNCDWLTDTDNGSVLQNLLYSPDNIEKGYRGVEPLDRFRIKSRQGPNQQIMIKVSNVPLPLPLTMLGGAYLLFALFRLRASFTRIIYSGKGATA